MSGLSVCLSVFHCLGPSLLGASNFFKLQFHWISERKECRCSVDDWWFIPSISAIASTQVLHPSYCTNNSVSILYWTSSDSSSFDVRVGQLRLSQNWKNVHCCTILRCTWTSIDNSDFGFSVLKFVLKLNNHYYITIFPFIRMNQSDFHIFFQITDKYSCRDYLLCAKLYSYCYLSLYTRERENGIYLSHVL